MWEVGFVAGLSWGWAGDTPGGGGGAREGGEGGGREGGMGEREGLGRERGGEGGEGGGGVGERPGPMSNMYIIIHSSGTIGRTFHVREIVKC